MTPFSEGKAVSEAENDIVSGLELASYIDVTPSTVANLAAKDHVVRLGRGKYALKASVRRYTGHLRESAAGRPGTREDLTAEKTRLTAAQADMAEMAKAEKENRMVDVEDVARTWANSCVTFRNIMLGVPNTVAFDLQHLSRFDVSEIDRIIREALTRMAELKAEPSEPEKPAPKGKRR